MSESEEMAVVRRCQAGDREAFSELAERHKAMLIGTAYLMTQDRQLAEDAMQEALVQMWKHIRSLRSPVGLKAWLVRIVINEVKKQARKKHVAMVTLEELAELAEVGGPDNGIGGGEIRHDLEQAMGMLPPDQREAVVLRFFSDLTVPDIAIATGCPEGTIKARLSRAMDKLGEILRNYQTSGPRR